MTRPHDPLGRLYYLRDYVGGNGITRFLYDGNAMISEYNGSGIMLRRYVHGSNAEADDPLVQFSGSAIDCPGTRFLHTDPRGSVVALADCWGNHQATNTYDEYGIPDSASGNDIATKGRFRYTGQAWLPELGMYYYKARVYSPTLGRFLQTDPIGYEDQFNLYAYVGNDPVNGVDPTGTQHAFAFALFDQSKDAEYDNDKNTNGPTAAATFAVRTFMAAAAIVTTQAIGAKIAAPVLNSTSRAYRVASEGGLHKGWLNNARKMTTRQLEKSERSLTRKANEHREYIRNNDAARKYVDGKSGKGTWDKMSSSEKSQTRDFWRKEAENYSDQADIARDVRRAKELER